MATPLLKEIRGTPDIERRFRSAFSDAIKACQKRSGKRRRDIARELSEALGRPADHPITETQLRDFTRNFTVKRQVRFHAPWVPLVCEILGDDTLARQLLNKRSQRVLSLGERVLDARSTLENVVAEIMGLTADAPEETQRSNRKRGRR